MVDARVYHDRTRHTPRGVRRDDFRLDYANQPRPYKVYEGLPRVSLPSIRAIRQPALSVVAESRADPLARAEQPAPALPDREALATLCYAASGVVKTTTVGGREMAFRAASCTGKLYHVDLYLICGDCGGIDDGVYHFDPRTFALDVLRRGDYRGVVAEAAGRHGAVTDTPVSIVVTSTWWRNAWKYRDRTYRHAFWDSGTVLANLLAAAHALDYRAETVCGVADGPLVDLLGVDPDREAPLEVVAVGAGSQTPGPPDFEAFDPASRPLSEHTVDYPLVVDAWKQSTLDGGDAAADWSEGCQTAGVIGTATAGDGDRVPLDPVDHATASARPLHHTIVRRGSCREFSDEPISRRKVGTVLDRALRGVPADWNDGVATGLQYNDVYCLVVDVDEIPDGTYQFHTGAAELERLGGVDRQTKSHLALDQIWAGEAHVNVYLMADVDAIVERLGNRGYRATQLEAGITLGRLYLATYAHRELGGTGLTFYDDEVTDHLSPRASEQTPTCLFAFGKRA